MLIKYKILKIIKIRFNDQNLFWLVDEVRNIYETHSHNYEISILRSGEGV